MCVILYQCILLTETFRDGPSREDSHRAEAGGDRREGEAEGTSQEQTHGVWLARRDQDPS